MSGVLHVSIEAEPDLDAEDPDELSLLGKEGTVLVFVVVLVVVVMCDKEGTADLSDDLPSSECAHSSIVGSNVVEVLIEAWGMLEAVAEEGGGRTGYLLRQRESKSTVLSFGVGLGRGILT